ncbi:hypothetical protein VDGL01_05595 [Verticillium dahliae]
MSCGGVDVVARQRRATLSATWTVGRSVAHSPDASKGVACATPFLHSDVAHDGPSESKSRCEARDRFVPVVPWYSRILRKLGGCTPTHANVDQIERSAQHAKHLTGWDAPRNGWCPPDRVPNGRSARGMKSSLRPLHLLLPLVVIAHDPARYNTEQDVPRPTSARMDGLVGRRHMRRGRSSRGQKRRLFDQGDLANTAAMSGLLKGCGFFDHELRVPDGPSRSEEPRLRLDTQGDYAQPLAQAQAGLLLLARPGRVPISAQAHS